MKFVTVINFSNVSDNIQRTCVYPGVRNISFSENFANMLSGWPHIFLNSFVHPLYSILDNKYLPAEPTFRKSVPSLLFSLKTL